MPSGCFFPRPKVDSAVIRIEPYKVPRFTKEQTNGASKLIKASFSQRRKTLVNSLSGIFADMTKTELGDIVSETLGMGADVRGEKLEAGDFVKLYEALKDRM